MSAISITAYDWVPDIAKGQVRDLRLRWALEEAGLPYEVELVAQGSQGEPANLKRQPFGQIPTMEQDGVTMFETGACVWRIAERSEALLPPDQADRDACLSWVFAALNSVEPAAFMLGFLRFCELDPARFGLKEAQTAKDMNPAAKGQFDQRLKRVAQALDGRSHLVAGRFTVADLMMTSVLVSAEKRGLLADHPEIAAYFDLHASRPGYRKAIADQLATFAEHEAQYARG